MLVGLEAACISLRSTYEDYGTNTTSAAASLDLISALVLAAILYVEHRHAIRSSAFIALYLALMMLVDVARCRSYFLRGLTALGAVTAVSPFVRLALLVLEEIPKGNLLVDREIRRQSEGEATNGFWGRTFYAYLTPIFHLGIRGSIQMSDLPSIGVEFSSKRLLSQLSKSRKPRHRASANSLLWACCKAFLGPIIVAAIPRLLSTGFIFGQPFVMQRVINKINNGEESEESNASLIGAVVLTFGGSAISRAIALQMEYRLLTRVRGSLVSSLVDKNLKLDSSEAKKHAAITLMSADFEGIIEGLPLCFEIPFVFVESILGMYFLAKFVKQSTFVIILPLIIATLLGILFGRYLSPANKRWNETIQIRVAQTSQILSQLMGIKMLGLEAKAVQCMDYLRYIEIQVSKTFRSIQIGLICSSTATDLLVPTIVVAAALFWGTFGKKMDPEVVFPTLAVVAIVQTPLARLFAAYAKSIAMAGCFERIDEFLSQNEHIDPRVLLDILPKEFTRPWPTPCGEMEVSTKTLVQHPSRIAHFDNVTLAPQGNTEKIVLKDVNLSLAHGSINGVFGGTGSGKTTFMNSLLGEAAITDGILYVNDVPIASAGQVPWLPNASVRDCVIGQCEYNAHWFNVVVTGCLLWDDINSFPDGVDHIVGSGGVALSGGQRQRISAARAAYARMRLVIMDDPFSSLDRPTANALVNNLCGPNGLFRQSNSTVVFSSYLPESMDAADNLLYLNGKGELVSGSSADTSLRARIRSVLRQEYRPALAGAQPANTQSSTSAAQPSGIQRVPERASSKGDFKLYQLWMQEAGSLGLFGWLIIIIVSGLGNAIPRLYLLYWMGNAPEDKHYFILYAFLPLIFAIVTGAGLYLLFQHLCARASINLHRRMAVTVAGSTIGFLSATDTGYLLSRFTVDMEILTKRIPASLHNTFYFGVGTIAQLGMALSAATYMTLLIPVIIVALFFVQKYYLRTSRQLRRLDLESQGPIVAALREASDGLIHIRGFGWQERVIERSLEAIDESQKPVYLLYSAQQCLGLATNLIAAFIGIILAIVALYAKQGTTANSAGLSFLSVIVLGGYFNDTIRHWTLMETAVGSLRRLHELLLHAVLESNERTAPVPDNWPSAGGVVLNNVTARYRSDETVQAPVLQEVSVTIAPGKKVGITGRSGSGKTSLLYSLLGFLDYDGTIFIDGINIATVPLDELRARIVTISQDQVQLDGTIRENMLPFDKPWGRPPANVDEKQSEAEKSRDRVVREVLVRLRIWEQLEQKKGLDTRLKEAGFSHGEMQLLCIARAVVRRRLTDSKLLLVDEATGSLDSFRDQTVREMMKEYFRGCTIIVVAHREESIADSTLTIEMRAGKMMKPKPYP